MTNPTVVSEDGTGDPAGDGCLASAIDLGPWYGTPGTHSYELSATADGGWEFVRFDWTQVQADNYGSVNTFSRSKGDKNTTVVRDDLYLWDGSIDYGGYVVSATITCIAIFKKGKESTITVRTSASPVAGGTTTPTSETRTGKVGQSETFDLVAEEADGYEFKRWEDEDGSRISKSKTTSVTKTYIEDPQTFDYTAIFRKMTGKILCNDSGVILHGASGSILYDG